MSQGAPALAKQVLRVMGLIATSGTAIGLLSVRIVRCVSYNAPSEIVTSKQLQGRDVAHDLNSNGFDRLIGILPSRRATEPRDMSFGLHAVLQSYLQGDVSTAMAAYDQPLDMVYRDLTMSLIRQTGSLKPLLLAAGASCVNAPSWVPNYSQPFSSFRLPSCELRLGSVNFKPFWKLDSSDTDVLVVKGIQLDQVLSVDAFHRTSTEYHETEDHIHVRHTHLLRYWCLNSLRGENKVTSYTAWLGMRDKSDVGTFEKYLASAIPSAGLADITAYMVVIRTNDAWCRIRQAQLTRLHIDITNFLAEQNFRLLRMKSGATNYCFGMAEVGDGAYLVSGVPHALLVRSVGLRSRLTATVYPEETGFALKKQLDKLQKTAHETSGGRIPHPMKFSLYSSDADSKVEELLSEIRIC
jgi:hypothetical protein